MKQSEKDLKKVMWEIAQEMKTGKRIRYFDPNETDFLAMLSEAEKAGTKAFSQDEFEHYSKDISKQVEAQAEAVREMKQMELERGRARNEAITAGAEKFLTKWNERIPIQRRLPDAEIKYFVRQYTGSAGSDRFIDLKRAEKALGARWNDDRNEFVKITDDNEFEK